MGRAVLARMQDLRAAAGVIRAAWKIMEHSGIAIIALRVLQPDVPPRDQHRRLALLHQRHAPPHLRHALRHLRLVQNALPLGRALSGQNVLARDVPQDAEVKLNRVMRRAAAVDAAVLGVRAIQNFA